MIDSLIAAPWWVSAIAAVVGFAFFFWFVPSVIAGHPAFGLVAQLFRPLAYLCLLGLGAIAIVNLFRELFANKKISGPRGHEESILPQPKDLTHNSGIVGEVWAFLRSRKPASEAGACPQVWSLDLLRQLEWKRFEEVCAAYYQETGFRTETIRCGADGGVDARLFAAGGTESLAIVQCKAWNSRAVGVKPVRELLGVMTHEAVGRGIFITTGDYTKEALDFAQPNNLELINGREFMAKIGALPAQSAQRLLSVATEGDYTTPTCPSCGVKMLRRSGTRGNFWGCRNFPRCRQKFQIVA